MPEFDEIYTREYSNLDALEQMVEKLVILTHIYSREFQIYVDKGHGKTLLEQLWNGHFKDEEVDLANLFEKVNQPYRQKLVGLMHEDLARLKDMPASGRNYIEPYEKMMERFDNKFKRKYRFVANPMRE